MKTDTALKVFFTLMLATGTSGLALASLALYGMICNGGIIVFVSFACLTVLWVVVCVWTLP